jgi:hypothetical protein
MKSLKLNKETIRVLVSADLDQVHGGRGQFQPTSTVQTIRHRGQFQPTSTVQTITRGGPQTGVRPISTVRPTVSSIRPTSSAVGATTKW